MNELNETTKEAGDYSIKRCIDLLETIEELSDEEMAQATNVLKCEVNR
jgi:transcription initiation factor IIE alpha subunit